MSPYNPAVDDGALGKHLPPGGPHYRAFVGPPGCYDLAGAWQFALLSALGLREEHYLADIGCGSLRGGRLFITYLLPGRYFGLEPQRWLVEQGLERELGSDIVRVKQPTFRYADDYGLGEFGQKFDFLLAQSIFSHAPPEQIRRCLAEAAKVMHDGSIFAATFYRRSADHEGNEWVYPGHVGYRLPTIAGFAREHGLACRPVDWEHHTGQIWVVFTKAGGRVKPSLRPRRRALAWAHQVARVARARAVEVRIR